MDNDVRLSYQEEVEVEDSLIRSRTQMLIDFPFFGIISLNLQLQQDYSIETAATDGKKFYYNPKFIQSLTTGEINWIVMHEVMHPALGHLWRKNDRIHLPWNIACDYAIHDILVEYKESQDNKLKDKLSMPVGCLYDKKYTGKSAEQIYDELDIKVIISNGDKGSEECGRLGKGWVIDDHSKWEEAGKDQSGEQEWNEKLVNSAKNAGNVPNGISVKIENILNPKKDWRKLLAEFVQTEVVDYSFNPPDRRFGDFDFFMPDFNDTEDVVKDIIFLADCSGSVSDKDLQEFYSELVGAVNQFKDKLSGKIGFFDTKVYGLHEFNSVKDVLKLRPKGRGGTDFIQALKYLSKNTEVSEVSAIVILTDGYAEFPIEKEARGIPVLWVINNDSVKPPWGAHTVLV